MLRGQHSSPAVEVKVGPVRHTAQLDAVSLLLSEQLQRVPGALSPCSGVLAAPEGHLEGPDEPAVGPDSAHLQVPGHPVDDPDILGPDTGAESIPEMRTDLRCLQRRH